MFLRSMKRFIDDVSGATALEYGLLAALVVTAIVGGVTALGGKAGSSYTNLASSVKVIDLRQRRRFGTLRLNH